MNILNGDTRTVTCDPMNDTDVWYIMRQVNHRRLSSNHCSRIDTWRSRHADMYGTACLLVYAGKGGGGGYRGPRLCFLSHCVFLLIRLLVHGVAYGKTRHEFGDQTHSAHRLTLRMCKRIISTLMSAAFRSFPVPTGCDVLGTDVQYEPTNNWTADRARAELSSPAEHRPRRYQAPEFAGEMPRKHVLRMHVVAYQQPLLCGW